MHMWMPCNFGEKIRIRQHSTYPLEEVELIGLTIGIRYQDGAEYVFEFLTKRGKIISMALEDKIAFWPNAFNNKECYDESSLNCGEIDLVIYPSDKYIKYNRYFLDSKSSAEGRCVSIMKHEDGWHYCFFGHDGLGKYFTVDELIVNKSFEAYADDPILL